MSDHVIVFIPRLHISTIIVYVLGENILNEALISYKRLRGVSRASIFQSDYVVSSVSKRFDDMPELIGGIGKTVNEKNCALIS